MVYKDEKGFPVDQTLDGGDSAVRMGILSMADVGDARFRIHKYVLKGDPFKCVRHPFQDPWNNPKNFTKDQLKLLVAGLVAAGETDLCRQIYFAHKKRGRCQNVERDAVGSEKKWYPHSFFKDSIPSTITVPARFDWKNFKFTHPVEIELAYQYYEEIETKLFDGPDILLPSDWEFLAVAGGLKRPGGFGLWFHRQALKFHAKNPENEEQNQMVAECYVLGTLKEYAKYSHQYDLLSVRGRQYWGDRGEMAYNFYCAGIVSHNGI